jgi:hypothetical protein
VSRIPGAPRHFIESFLVTTDDLYLAKASHVGKIVSLRDWVLDAG